MQIFLFKKQIITWAGTCLPILTCDVQYQVGGDISHSVFIIVILKEQPGSWQIGPWMERRSLVEILRAATACLPRYACNHSISLGNLVCVCVFWK